MDDSHGWVTVQSSMQSLLHSHSHSHLPARTHHFPFRVSCFEFSRPISLLSSPLPLSPADSPSISVFFHTQHTHTLTHTVIWGIYRGVVELVMGLCFDARWEITGPRSRDKSTTKTQVSALAYALQTHSRKRTYTTSVQNRPSMFTHTQAHTYVHTNI